MIICKDNHNQSKEVLIPLNAGALPVLVQRLNLSTIDTWTEQSFV